MFKLILKVMITITVFLYRSTGGGIGGRYKDCRSFYSPPLGAHLANREPCQWGISETVPPT
jgi:hypothetical protein